MSKELKILKSRNRQKEKSKSLETAFKTDYSNKNRVKWKKNQLYLIKFPF